MIKSFASDETAKLWQGTRSRRLPPDIQKRALMKLQLIDAAVELAFLRLPPGNRLEPLRGNRTGQHSIRINVDAVISAGQRRLAWRTASRTNSSPRPGCWSSCQLLASLILARTYLRSAVIHDFLQHLHNVRFGEWNLQATISFHFSKALADFRSLGLSKKGRLLVLLRQAKRGRK